MTKKNGISEKIKKASSLLSFSPDELFSNLDENEKKEILSACSIIYNNKIFQKICNEIYTKEIMDTIQNSNDIVALAEGRGKILGVAGVLEIIKSYHLEYIDFISKSEQMTPEELHEII